MLPQPLLEVVQIRGWFNDSRYWVQLSNKISIKTTRHHSGSGSGSNPNWCLIYVLQKKRRRQDFSDWILNATTGIFFVSEIEMRFKCHSWIQQDTVESPRHPPGSVDHEELRPSSIDSPKWVAWPELHSPVHHEVRHVPRSIQIVSMLSRESSLVDPTWQWEHLVQSWKGGF